MLITIVVNVMQMLGWPKDNVKAKKRAKFVPKQYANLSILLR